MSSPNKTPPTLDEFRARAALTGLTLTEEDIGHLHKGYVGLIELMQRIPQRETTEQWLHAPHSCSPEKHALGGGDTAWRWG